MVPLSRSVNHAFKEAACPVYALSIQPNLLGQSVTLSRLLSNQLRE
jgi:hypothetical protein